MRPALVPIVVIMAGMAGSATATTTEQLEAQSTAEIRAARASIHEPAEIAQSPWLLFNPARARSYCDPGVLVTAERFGRDCKVEIGKVIQAMGRLAPKILAPGVDLGVLTGSPATPEQRAAEGMQTIQDVATWVGLPVSSVSCLTKGLVRAVAGEHAATDDMLATVDGATDLYQLAGLVKAGAGGVRALASPPPGAPVVTRLGALGSDMSKALGEDVGGALDTGLGPTQAPGWFDRIGNAWSRTSVSRWWDLTATADAAREQFEACDVDGALATQEQVPGLARAWATGWRNWIELYEFEKFCAETGLMADIGLDGTVKGRLEEQVSSYSSELGDLQSRGLLDPDWATPESLDRQRALIEELRVLLNAPDRLIDQALDGTCDLSDVLTAFRDAESHNACFESLADGPARRRLADARERIRAIQLALPDLQSAVTAAASEAASRIDTCRLTDWSEPLDRAVIDFNELHGPRVTAGELQSCLSEDLQFDVLRQQADVREKELAQLTGEARDLHDAAVESTQLCRFDEAAAVLGEAALKIEETRCPIAQQDCEGVSYEPVRCSLLIVRDGIDDALADLDERRQAWDEANQELEQRGADLETKGALQLELVRGRSPGRCPAVDQAQSIAADLEGLAAPLDCPSDGRWIDAAASLRQQLEDALAAFNQELETAERAARDVIDSCDEKAISSARDRLAPLEAASCPSRSDGAARLEARLAELDESLATARRIIAEARQDWHAWMQSCDPDLLQTTEARQSLLGSCGYARLSPDEQAEVGQLMWWGETGADLRALSLAAEPHLAAAQRNIDTAIDHLRTGRPVDDVRQLMSTALDRARASLDEARRAAAKMAAGELIPDACPRRVQERIAELEAAIPELPEPDSTGDDDGLITSDPAIITAGTIVIGSTSETRTATSSPSVSEATTVVVPDLLGQKQKVAIAWLQEMDLHPVLRAGDAATSPDDEETVADMSPAPGTSVPSDTAVSLWIRGTAPEPVPQRTAAASAQPAVTQATCDRQWPGTVLMAGASPGAAACLCPSGTAWSAVRRACLSLMGAGGGQGAGAADCSARPGTLFDPASGRCRCPVGEWDATHGRCFDTAAAERQRRVEDEQQAADCERLYADIEAFSSNPEPLYQQQAASARQNARSLGCDAGRVSAAVAASSRFGPPQGGTTGGGSSTGGGGGSSSSSGGSSTAAGSGGGGSLCVISNISYSSGGSGANSYLAYSLPSNAPGRAPDAFGVLTVPTRVEQGDEVICTGARACLPVVAPSNPFRILSEHRSFSAADAVARSRCPNPIHSATYGGR